MQCPNCGNAIEPNDLFCGECGHKIDRQSQTINSAEKDISNAEANGRRQDSNESLGEGNETTSHQSNHLSRTNESKHDKHSYEEGKVPIISMYLNRLHRHNNIKCINHSQISTNNLTTT